MKQANQFSWDQFSWYLSRFGRAFSDMVTAMNVIVCDAVIDCEKGNITNEQLTVIRKMADYFENVNYRNSEELK